MEERRKHGRFPLLLPARIEVLTPEGRQVLDLQTSNVSAGGALFDTKEDIVVGTEVRINITLPSVRLEELTGAQSLVKVLGKVVRSGPAGLAISFYENYQLVKLRSP